MGSMHSLGAASGGDTVSMGEGPLSSAVKSPPPSLFLVMVALTAWPTAYAMMFQRQQTPPALGQGTSSCSWSMARGAGGGRGRENTVHRTSNRGERLVLHPEIRFIAGSKPNSLQRGSLFALLPELASPQQGQVQGAEEWRKS